MEFVTDAAAAGACAACSAVALLTLAAGFLKAFARFDAWNEGQRLRGPKGDRGEAETPAPTRDRHAAQGVTPDG